MRTTTPAAEDYLKALHSLEEGGGETGTNEVAARLGVSAASATSMLKKLDGMGLVVHVPYRGASLTEAGRKVALEIIRHHRLLETYLAEALGVPWDEVHDEAEILEHVLSESLEDRIAELLGHPVTDPHGHPIPARDGSLPPLPTRRLADLADGETSLVERVSDSDPAVLRELGEIGLRPGSTVQVTGRKGGDVLVRVSSPESGEHRLRREVADAVWAR